MRYLILFLSITATLLLAAGCGEEPVNEAPGGGGAPTSGSTSQAQGTPPGTSSTTDSVVVIDFESLSAYFSRPWCCSLVSVTFPFNGDGFTVTNLNPSRLGNFPTAYFYGVRPNTPGWTGSIALFISPGGTAVLTKDDGHAFDVQSIDLTGVKFFGSAHVAFTGERADGSTVSATFTTPFRAFGMRTYKFFGFNDLVSLSWEDANPSVASQFDNIVIGPTGIAVGLDVKPGSDSNPVNLRSHGAIPVAIMGSDSFAASSVDTGTLAFGPGGAAPMDRNGGSLEDVNDDGIPDLVSHYRTQDAGLGSGDTQACVTGATVAGRDLRGCDAITMIGHGRQ